MTAPRPSSFIDASTWLADPSSSQLDVGSARLLALNTIDEPRGQLIFGELGNPIPFEVRRMFMIRGVPDENIRGEHAHRALHQLLICTAGSVEAAVDDGHVRKTILLNTPRVGLHMPPGTWGVQQRYSRDANLLVLASHEYDAADYIRDYAEFQIFVGARA